VPAVAVIRRRLVLFIFNRFIGYLDGKSSLHRNYFSRVLCGKVELPEESQNSVILVGRTTAKATFYVITDVEGRSLG
jgi:hypothetical protein